MREKDGGTDLILFLLPILLLIGLNMRERAEWEQSLKSKETVQVVKQTADVQGAVKVVEKRVKEDDEVKEPSIEGDEYVLERGEVVVAAFTSGDTVEVVKPGRVMGIDCPDCGERIPLKVGELGDRYTNETDCPVCGKRLVVGF